MEHKKTLDLMTSIEVAEYLSTAEATIRYWRHKGVGPRSVRLVGRVMYRRQDVDAWFMDQLESDDKVGA